MSNYPEFSSILVQTNLFTGVQADDLAQWFENKPYRILNFEKDLFVAHSNEPCNDLLILLAGSVRGEMHDFSGKHLKIEDLKAPCPLATAFLFGSHNRFPVSIISNQSSDVMFIPRDVFLFLMQKSPAILTNFLAVISNRAQFLSARIRFLALPSIRQKIARYLLQTVKSGTDTVFLNQTHAELAGYFGVARPSLTRTLSEMQSGEMIVVKRGEIRITNREKLNKLLQE